MRMFFILLTALALTAPITVQAYAPDVFKVCGLNPNGDNFLALRAGPGSNYQMLERLGPGTGRCCTTLTVDDSHRESMRLHGLYEQAIPRPLP
ncbi:hypothetical protein V8324_21335, partial [Roseovarius sp. D22-M7]